MSIKAPMSTFQVLTNLPLIFLITNMKIGEVVSKIEVGRKMKE
jgi:hypothetical protein